MNWKITSSLMALPIASLLFLAGCGDGGYDYADDADFNEPDTTSSGYTDTTTAEPGTDDSLASTEKATNDPSSIDPTTDAAQARTDTAQMNATSAAQPKDQGSTAANVDTQAKDATTAKTEDQPKDATTAKTEDQPKDATTAKTEDQPKDATTAMAEDQPKDTTTAKTEDQPKDATATKTEDQPKGAVKAEDDQQVAKKEAAEDSLHTTGDWTLPIDGEDGLKVIRKGPKVVQVGDTYRYTLEVTNLMDYPIHGITLTETFDGALESRKEAKTEQLDAEKKASKDMDLAKAEAVKAEASSSSKETNEKLTADKVSVSQRKIEVGSLDSGEKTTIEREFTAQEVGQGRIFMTVDYIQAMASVVEVIEPELELERKVVNADGKPVEQAYLCDQVFFQYTVRNIESAKSDKNVSIREELPDGFTAEGKQVIERNFGKLAPGDFEEFRVPIKAEKAGAHYGYAAAYTDTIEVRSKNAKLNVVEPKVKLTMNGPKEQYVDRTASYEMTLKNVGDVATENTVVKLDLPENITPSLTSDKYSVKEGAIEIGKLNPGQTVPIRMEFGPNAPGNITIGATLEATCAKAQSAKVATNVIGIPALQMEVVDQTDPLPAGENTIYVVRLLNEGSAKATGLSMEFELPKSTDFVQAQGPAKFTEKDHVVTVNGLKDLDPGSEATFTVTVKAVKPGNDVFAVKVDSDSLSRAITVMEPTTIIGTPSEDAKQMAAQKQDEKTAMNQKAAQNEKAPVDSAAAKTEAKEADDQTAAADKPQDSAEKVAMNKAESTQEPATSSAKDEQAKESKAAKENPDSKMASKPQEEAKEQTDAAESKKDGEWRTALNDTKPVERNAEAKDTKTASNMETFEGTVEGFREVSVEGADKQFQEHTQVRIRLKNGDSTIADLGQSTKLSDLNLKGGDQILIEGVRKDVSGEKVLMVRTLKIGGEEVEIQREDAESELKVSQK